MPDTSIEGNAASDGSMEIEDEAMLKGVAGGGQDGYKHVKCPNCGARCGALGFNYEWKFNCHKCGHYWVEYDL